MFYMTWGKVLPGTKNNNTGCNADKDWFGFTFDSWAQFNKTGHSQGHLGISKSSVSFEN